MVGITEKINLKSRQGEAIIQYTEDFAAPGSTTPQQFQRTDDGVYIQISGSATAITAIVERSTKDPTRETANWAPAMAIPITGDLSAGIAPFIFNEPARGYWRVRITTLTGGTCTVVISGEQA